MTFNINLDGKLTNTNLLVDSLQCSINDIEILKAQDIINNYLQAQNNSLDNIPRFACQRIFVPSFYCIADCVFDLQTQRSCVHTKFDPSYNGVTEIIDIHNINGVNVRYIQYGNFWQEVGLSDASSNLGESFYNIFHTDLCIVSV